ncbi:MAG TPA: VOC family protein [Pseudobdellovibrionaceae bacterium]|nr:VOC family protein [Pseudobdellovibrionaceae bacterium]
MLKSIDAVFISTPNMEKVIDFYKTLGVPLKVNDHGGGLHAEADFGDVHFAIQPWTSHDAPKGNVSFSFQVPNLEEYCRELESKGLKFTRPATPMPFGGVIAVIHDPDGNQIFLNRWQSDEEYEKNFPAKK